MPGKNVLDFTPEQFEEMAKAQAERLTSGDKLLEMQFGALAMDPAFNKRFLSAAFNAGLNPLDEAVQLQVRALVIAFFMYGIELGKVTNVQTNKFLN